MQHLLDQLNPEQRQAVEHPVGTPAIVLAGAGSGKTRVLTTRAAWLMATQDVLPTEILLVTFTNKAAGEMRQRIQTMTGLTLPFAGTFHSLCAKILRQHGTAIGLDPNFVIYDSDDQLALIKQIYKQNGISTKELNPKGVKAVISEAKNELLTPNEYEETALGSYQNKVARIYHLYQRALQQAQAVDFDDLLTKTVDLLKNSQAVLTHFQAQFKHVLIDEYQDTNKAQYQLTQLLAAPQNNLFVVGDFAQSIYAWRGADYRNMLLLKKDYPQIKEYRLEQNYRSTQTILDAASSVIANNTSHPVLSLWTEQTNKEKIGLLAARSNYDEAHMVVRAIQDLDPTLPHDEIAILYRTNAQSRAIEEALMMARIPYRIVGGFKFYERKEIKDILAYLKLLINKADTVSKERALKIGKRRFAKFEKFVMANQTSAKPETNPATLIEKIIDVTSYEDKFDNKDPDDQSRLENIQELLNVAAQFTEVPEFLENVALVQDDAMADIALNQPQGQVTLMSLHSAKGLEFSVVFMVGVEEGLLPHSRSQLDPHQLEEERRLCYVGITRAKQKLFLSFAQQRYQYGQLTPSMQSRFFSEIPEHLFENLSTQSNFSSPNSHKPKPSSGSGRRYVPLDDDSLDSLLDGDIDIDTFLNS